jgi:hypothetical protein
MNIDRIVFSTAGTLVLIGLGLGFFANSWWYLLPALVGLNMFQAGLTRFCPLAVVLKRLGVPPGGAF